RHVADGHPLVHRHPLDGVPAVLVGVADAAHDAKPSDDLEDDVLGVDAGRQLTADGDPTQLKRIQREALGGEHVADLRRANSERPGTECAVRGRVAVAAGDRHARLRQSELGTDDVDDALRSAREIEQPHARIAAVALERAEHVLRHRVEERPRLIFRRDDVIDGCDLAVRETNPPPARFQHVEGLRARDFVDEMKAAEPLGRPVGQLANGVGVPDFLEEGCGHSVIEMVLRHGARRTAHGARRTAFRRSAFRRSAFRRSPRLGACHCPPATLVSRCVRGGGWQIRATRPVQHIGDSAMAKLKTFRDLDVWNAAMDLASLCYRVTDVFPKSELYSLTAQIRRAAVSISANAAEGHNRKARKAYCNHISIALGSHAELESLLELAKRLAYLDANRFTTLEETIRRTGQMLYGLWRALRKSPVTEHAD